MVRTFFPCLDLTGFCDMCSKLYRKNQDGTIFERLMAYSGLSVLCSDFSALINGSESEHHHQLSRAFSQHMLKTVDVLPAVMTPSWEGIEAVSTAVRGMTTCGPYLLEANSYLQGVRMPGIMQATARPDAHLYCGQILPGTWLQPAQYTKPRQ